ncbi:MAG: metallophosphoesterase family protein [Actinobacteria bacterium]|nr:metallophosphoesterase family protein [Actinomycetota bacterium]
MRVHVVSDVHGAGEALARAADGSDVFVCLGDLILFLDYDDPSRGIFADLFGSDYARAYIEARTANDFDRARELSSAAWAGRGIADSGQRWTVMQAMVEQQYEELFAAMPSPAVLTYGNVDVPGLWPQFLRAGQTVVDGGVVEVGTMRWGFVGGGLVSPMRTPYEIPEVDFARKVADLEPVDVLFTHIPPAIADLTYDVVARRFEVGSLALLEYIRDVQPRYHLFGHVHQPLARRTRIGRTECVNVGHFNALRRPFMIDL